MAKYILALDQGTTSSRAIVFDHDGRVVAKAQEEFEQILPGPGLVEHDPEAIWATQLGVARRAMAAASLSAADIAALGVTNQRETTILWERRTGRPVGQRRGLAKPRERGHLRSAEGRRLRADVPREDRPAVGPLFLRHQDQVSAGYARRAPRRGPKGRNPLRHRR